MMSPGWIRSPSFFLGLTSTFIRLNNISNSSNPAKYPPLFARIFAFEIESVGICGTDIAIYSGKHPRAKAPLVMGHEVGGIVSEISGKPAAGVEIGTRVTFYPLISCGTCRTCLSGKAYVCDTLKLIGIDFNGGMAEYVAVPSESVIPVARAMREGPYLF